MTITLWEIDSPTHAERVEAQRSIESAGGQVTWITEEEE